MILFFTYHKVRPGEDGGGPEFYTICIGRLSRQLRALAAGGFLCLDPAALPDLRDPTGSSFVLSFDDGTRDHYDLVSPLLQEHNCHAVFFVPTAKLNQPGYMSPDQLRDLAAAGHTIGLHSHRHKRLDTLPDGDVRDQLGLSQRILTDIIGVKPWIFAPPGGFLNESVRQVARSLGVQAIRTLQWGYNKELNLLDLETIVINRYVTDRRFQGFLQPHHRRLLYLSKQCAKAIVPSRGYEALRNLLFRMTRKD